VVIGASENPERYSNKAVKKLTAFGHPVVAVGLRKGNIDNVEIHDDRPIEKEVDTVTLYVGPQNQQAWKDYIFSLHPKRIIFNPGTENHSFQQEASALGIETIEACTLVMLSLDNY